MTYDDMMYRALSVALHSPDPSTQNGAVLLGPGGGAIAEACNAFPLGVPYTDDRWERPAKYSYIEHAERNVVYMAARNGRRVHGGTLVCPWAACADCARAIIQAGVHTLVRLPGGGVDHTNARWDDSIAIADRMMHEAGVAVVELDAPPIGWGVRLRRDGEVVAL